MAKVLVMRSDGLYEEVSGAIVRNSGASVGTGSPQTITHGFGTTWTHLRIRLIPIDSDTVFSSYSFDGENGRDHFHVTVTNSKNWEWIAESW